MIEFYEGNLLNDDTDALVNTVNCVGTMGKGIALQFKQKYPAMFDAYHKDCLAGNVKIGTVHLYDTRELRPRWILNFPTKKHWKYPSKIEYITEGLADLVRVIGECRIHSVAVPALGCGNGGLDWADVLPLIKATFDKMPVVVHLYPPCGLGDGL